MKKLTLEYVKNRLYEEYGDEYDFDFSTFDGAGVKIKCFCHKKDKEGNEHGEFWITPTELLGKRKRGCPKCGKEKQINSLRLTVNEINEKLDKISNGLYHLKEDTVYKNNSEKYIFTCKKHGEFKSTVGCLLGGHSCPKCRYEHSAQTQSLTIEEFKEKLENVHHGMIETTPNSVYVNNRTSIELYCHHRDKDGQEHGVFMGAPSNILFGRGCKKCKRDKLREFHLKPFDEFEKDAIEKHGKKYVYDKDSYTETHNNMRIFCSVKDEDGEPHGWFLQSPHAHLSGQGCPICKENKMEREIRLFLKRNNIEFEHGHRFDWLLYKEPLVLDFYLPGYKVIIECQGIQHFESVELFGGDVDMEIRRKRDEVKKRLCDEHGIQIFYYSTISKYNTFLDKKVFHNKEELLKEIKKNKEL